jgi:peptidoglycan/xylan/chitin deacetylase (PgdA/CDA1 family)
MRTRVLITVDTEFSIGGAFDPPYGSVEPIGSQNVLCIVEGVSEGLGFVLDTLSKHAAPATFFVETMQTAFFGDQPMGDVGRRIASQGHDVQLHLHPVWTYFDKPDWRRRLVNEPPSDDFCGQSIDVVTSWIERGLQTFARWGIARPIAMRTGNLRVDSNVYHAMSKMQMKVASNIGRGMFEPADPALRCNGGIHRIEGIIELPVLTYVGLGVGKWTKLKSLTITGSSSEEMIYLLNRAHAERYPAVVVLTHCHEFVKGDVREGIRANRITQSRLRSLCDFLVAENRRFDVTTMAAMTDTPIHTAIEVDPLLKVPTILALRRIAQNVLTDYNVH